MKVASTPIPRDASRCCNTISVRLINQSRLNIETSRPCKEQREQVHHRVGHRDNFLVSYEYGNNVSKLSIDKKESRACRSRKQYQLPSRTIQARCHDSCKAITATEATAAAEDQSENARTPRIIRQRKPLKIAANQKTIFSRPCQGTEKYQIVKKQLKKQSNRGWQTCAVNIHQLLFIHATANDETHNRSIEKAIRPTAAVHLHRAV